MSKTLALILIFILSYPIKIRYQSIPATTPLDIDLPLIQSRFDQEIIDHKYFKVSYNNSKRLANWVGYRLTRDNLSVRATERASVKYRVDPKVRVLGLNALPTNAFTGTGYHHGHIAPSADFLWSRDANEATFLMSNMMPQAEELNEGIWKQLEARVRGWACKEGSIQIIAGPIYGANPKKISHGIPVPEKFFKVVLDETFPVKTIGFIYSQDSEGGAVPVDEVERLTGFNFFPNLKDEQLEANYSIGSWKEDFCYKLASRNLDPREKWTCEKGAPVSGILKGAAEVTTG